MILLQAVEGKQAEEHSKHTCRVSSSCSYAHNLGFLPAVSCNIKFKVGGLK